MKFKFYRSLLLVFLLSSHSFAQDFDESFLKSLPDDIASDLINRSSEKRNLEEPQYRRPSTFIKKPDAKSTIFGADIFSMMQSSLMPINEPNFDSSYIIDFGDELELQLIGQKSSITKLYVKRDGSININDIGKVFLSGLSLGEAVNLVKSKISDSFIGTDAYLTLTNVRDITIVMAGNVYNPGTYTLNGNSNIFHALSVSGGPSEGGSFRSIDLVRNNKKIESVDLYDTFIFGKDSFSKRLRSGDIIFVSPVNNIVSVSGAVKRPGSYELLDGEKLSIAIEFANGLNSYADLSNIKLERVLDGSIKPISISNISQFDQIESKDSDKVVIRSYDFRSIRIDGSVLNPGTYRMKEGDTMFDTIEKAGGFTKNAYPFGAVYTNNQAELNNILAKEKLYNDLLDSLLVISSSKGDMFETSGIIELLNQLKNTKTSGRIVVDVNDKNSDPILVKNGDSILIPEITNQVYVYGEVSSDGSVLFEEGKDATFYINKKGGHGTNSDLKNVYVLHPNGESIRISRNKNVFTRQIKDVEIYPGSIIFVPRKIKNNSAALLRTQAYATILGNLGVSLASLAVLKD